MSGLTKFQAEVARLFFSLPGSSGFLLAGGAALLASGLTDRPTEDLDFFGEIGRSDVGAARDQLEAAILRRGWSSARLQDSETFVRLRLSGDGDLIVDIAIDSAAGRPPVVSGTPRGLTTSPPGPSKAPFCCPRSVHERPEFTYNGKTRLNTAVREVPVQMA